MVNKCFMILLVKGKTDYLFFQWQRGRGAELDDAFLGHCLLDVCHCREDERTKILGTVGVTTTTSSMRT